MIHSLSPQNKTEFKGRSADNPDKETTEYGDENRAKMHLILSGQERLMVTICPKCQEKTKTVLPVEFVTNPLTWKVQGIIAKLCLRCGSKR